MAACAVYVPPPAPCPHPQPLPRPRPHTPPPPLHCRSFGDYDKRLAVEMAWDAMTNVFKLPPQHLYATYFEGDAALGLGPDLVTRDLWLQFLPAERVLPFGCGDNFWEMGEVGPCGPCTELHLDKRYLLPPKERAAAAHMDAAQLVNADHPDVVELWNLVFIQNTRDAAGGPLRDLPHSHIDTGMGLERLTAVLQGAASNYDTDLFAPLLREAQAATGCERPYRGGAQHGAQASEEDVAYRVLADHARCLSFAIADGALPGEGHSHHNRNTLIADGALWQPPRVAGTCCAASCGGRPATRTMSWARPRTLCPWRGWCRPCWRHRAAPSPSSTRAPRTWRRWWRTRSSPSRACWGGGCASSTR